MKFIDVHTHKITTDTEIVSLVNYEIKVDIPLVGYASVGLHPWFINAQSIQDTLANIEKKLTQKNVIALGEFGLDKVRGETFEKQLFVFREQLKLAEQYQKPILLHCVKSYAEILALHKHNPTAVPWVLHGFRGNLILAKQLCSKNITLSFGEALVYNKTLQDTFKALPLANVMLETDDACVSIRSIYERAAQLKQISIVELQRQMMSNFKNIFHVEFE